MSPNPSPRSKASQDLCSWTIFGGAERPQKSSKALVFRGQCVSPASKGIIQIRNVRNRLRLLFSYGGKRHSIALELSNAIRK